MVGGARGFAGVPGAARISLDVADKVLGAPVRSLLELRARRRRSLTDEQTRREDAHINEQAQHGEDPRWYTRDFPVRRHNQLTPLLHGAEYFPDLCAAFAAARQRITIAGWCLTPFMPLQRDGVPGSDVVDLLDQTSRHAEVYVLLWSGAPAVFRPTVRDVERTQRLLRDRAPRVHCVLDRSAAFSHDQHQKAVSVDGRIAYVGGMDLTTFAGDRWDTVEHPLRFGPNWHDVQMRLEGEVVRDVEENFRQRWNAVTGEDLAPIDTIANPDWDTRAQIIRTIPEGMYPFAPGGIFGIRHALLGAIRGASRYIYLENQYLWAPDIVEALLEAMNRPHAHPFRIVVVLPARAYTGKYDNDAHVKALRAADRGREIFHAYSIYTSGPASGISGHHALPIYVHGKVSIIDDEWLSVGSANLNQRGLATDAEMNVQALTPAAGDLRCALWAEHLGMSRETVAAADPIGLIDGAWKETAKQVEVAVRSQSAFPAGQALTYRVGQRPGNRILDLMQEITLER